MVETIQKVPLIEKLELLDGILQGFIKGSRLNSPPACKPYGLEAEKMYGHFHSLKALIRLRAALIDLRKILRVKIWLFAGLEL